MSPAEICAVGAQSSSGAASGGGAVDGKEGRPGESDFCDTAAYIGALVDFTGEVGRFAVARATKRDFVAVEECLQVS